MARPGLTKHRKFIKLSRLLDSQIVAMGALELMWQRAYEHGDDLGEAEDVEYAVGWKGEAGTLVEALVAAGFVDRYPDGKLIVHDLDDHAPDYYRKRRAREAVRQRVSGQCPVSDRAATGQRPENGSTPTPTPTPTPAPVSATPTLVTNNAPILTGQGSHRQHVVCGRVCLPVFVYDELVRLKGGPDARVYVEAWAVRTLQALPADQTISEEAPKWWRGMWAHDHPPSLPAPAKRKTGFDVAAWAAKGATA